MDGVLEQTKLTYGTNSNESKGYLWEGGDRADWEGTGVRVSFCILIRVQVSQGSVFVLHLRFVHFTADFTSKQNKNSSESYARLGIGEPGGGL